MEKDLDLEREHKECCVCRCLVSADDDRCLMGDEFMREPGLLRAWDLEGKLHGLGARDREAPPVRLLVERAGFLEDGTPLFQVWRHEPDTAGLRRDLLEAFAAHQAALRPK